MHSGSRSLAGANNYSRASVEQSALVLDRVTVLSDRFVLLVRIPEGRPRYTTPEMAQRARALRPALSVHACVNDRGTTFDSVIECTSIPHLLEHVMIDIQTEQGTRPDTVFTGTTRWIDEVKGTARVEVSFESDMGAFAALENALATRDEIASPLANLS